MENSIINSLKSTLENHHARRKQGVLHFHASATMNRYDSYHHDVGDLFSTAVTNISHWSLDPCPGSPSLTHMWPNSDFIEYSFEHWNIF